MALIAHFKLNGDTIDTVGTYSSNTPTAITYTNLGKLDGAAIFNGSSSAILLGSTINLAGNANWTVSVWVKTTSTARMSILSNSSGGPVGSDICIEGGKIAYYHYNAAWLFKQGTISINDGNWHHLAWVNFVGNKMNMYVDGILDQSQVDSTTGTGPVNQIGKNWSTAYFNGTMDDLRIYNDAYLDKIVDLSFIRSLVGHWPLNGNTTDYSNFGRTLNLAGGTVSTIGKIGSSYLFDATNEYAYIPSANNNFQSVFNGNFAISFWYRMNSSAGTNRGLVQYGSAGVNTQLHILIRAANNLAFAFYGNDFETTFNPVADVWTHYTFVGDRDNMKQKVYINGIFHSERSVTAWLNATNSIMFIGYYAGYHPNGYLNDFRLYNYVLSDYQIQELAKAKILHYTFDDPYEEPTTNIVDALTTSYNAWGTNVGTSTYFTSPTGRNGVFLNITSFTDGGVNWYNSGGLKPCSPSTVYTVSAKIKYGKNTPNANLFYLRQYNSSQTQLSEFGLFSLANSVPDEHGYRLAYATFTTNASAAYLQMHAYEYQVNEIWIYDLQVEKKSSYTPYTTGSRSILTIADISGYKNNGTKYSSANISIVQDKKIGSYSMDFDGTGGIYAPAVTLANYTITFWANRDADNTMSIGNNGSTLSSNFYWYGDNSWRYTHGGVGAEFYYPKTDSIPIGSWGHYAVTYDGANVKIYRNGKYEGQQASTGSAVFSPGLSIGYALSYSFFNGRLDDVRLYATALSADDIKSIYQKRANIDNFGNVQVSEFIEKENLFKYINDAVENKTFVSGLSSYTQPNCQVTLTDQGYRIYRPANLVYPDAGTTMWGGLKIVMERPELTLQKNHKYRIMIRVKGQSSNQISPMYFTNNMGWSGGGLDPSPTQIKRIDLPANFQGEMDVLYEFSISDTIYKTCTTSYSGFVAGNTYMSYKDLAFGFQYTSTGTLGTDIYLTNFRLYDITNEDSLGEFNPNGIGNFDGLDEVSGTQNPAAQHEITNTGILIINGEFSEVD